MGAARGGGSRSRGLAHVSSDTRSICTPPCDARLGPRALPSWARDEWDVWGKRGESLPSHLVQGSTHSAPGPAVFSNSLHNSTVKNETALRQPPESGEDARAWEGLGWELKAVF